jgi:Zn-dependent peptidase ImmA (M78 family)
MDHGTPPSKVLEDLRNLNAEPRHNPPISHTHMLDHHYLDVPPGKVEEEAHLFGASFLMPEGDIKNQLTPLDLKRLIGLKRIWGVSVAALIMRAGTLRTITPKKKKTLFTQMSFYGYRKNEPVAIPREEPRLMSSLLRTLIEDHEFTGEKLRKHLFCTELELEEMGLTA